MQLGFMSSLFHQLSVEEVFAFAAEEGFSCVELMCWPDGDIPSKYKAITHVNVVNNTPSYREYLHNLIQKYSVQISGFGYYPNPLHAEVEDRQFVAQHIQKMIKFARDFGVRQVNTFIGRDQYLTNEANWQRVEEVWPAIIQAAEQANVTLTFENCPMLFSPDQWPGGQNLMNAPEQWRRLLQRFAGTSIGLNFDPSHLVWQFIDIDKAVREFGSHIRHVHAKDTRINLARLQEVGILGMGWHQAKLPGLGQIDWRAFFSALTDVGYRGPVCIEVEDQAFEGSLADRKTALRQSKRYLEQFIG